MPISGNPTPGPVMGFQRPEIPDIEDVLMALFHEQFPEIGEDNIGTGLPASFEDRLPFVSITRIGGPTTMLEDFPLVDVEVFGSYYEARSLAKRIHSLLIAAPHYALGVLLDTVDNLQAPVELPEVDDTTRRFHSSYQISLRG